MALFSGQIQQIILLLIIFVIIYQVYNYTYKARYGDYLSSTKFMDVPYSVKCFFGEDNCEEGDIDGWTIIHGLMYFIIGLIVPDHYLFILGVSVAFEFVQPYLGNSSRYIINPLVSLTGYAIGSVLSPRQEGFKEKYQLLVN